MPDGVCAARASQETMRILFTCLLLMLLFATGLSKPANLKPKPIDKRQNETPYEKFKRQHVDAKMTAKKCEAEIKNKQIYNVDNSCKDTNTFILSDYEKVKAICNGHGSPHKNTCLTESKAKFSIVKCELKNNGGRKPNCQYKGKLLTNRIVVVQCGGLPVHFEKDIVTFESNNAAIGKIPMDDTSVPTNIHV
ncbi:ribonuclease-like [Oreochromis aureus]|uniref:ribonuclease-like n=1 Tax=Oreochromis aureus TaxID=47969 RepID=UPI001952EA33|nr:ribonuclease-like [Oreochromis aureus]